MRLRFRPFVITATMAAVAGLAVDICACASKSPQSESTPTATAAPPVATGSAPAEVSPEASVGVASTGAASVGSTSAGAPSTGSASAGSASAGPAPAGSAAPPEHGQTSDERRAALDKRLNDSLGSFDAKLRGEQQKIAQERDARQTTVATVAESDGKPESDKSNEAAVSDATEASGAHDTRTGRGESRSARAGDLKSDKSAGGSYGNATGNGAVATEIPDGNDDDVVARRLRKAAEQETDPELKEKLWKEYVEYKKNAQGARG